MRTITSKVIALIDAGKAGKPGPRDRVEKNTDGSVSAILHNSVYVTVEADQIILGVEGGRWQTNTTRGRINAIACHFKLPCISQKNWVWTWTDGVPYDGKRVFKRKE